MAKNNLFDAKLDEYLYEFATNWYSSDACLQMEHCRWVERAVNITMIE